MSEPEKTRRFDRVVLPHLDAAYNLARWLTRNDQDARDIAQESCLRAYKFFDSLRGDNARAWLLGIVRNTFYTWLGQQRKHQAHASFDEDFHGADAEPGPDFGDPQDLALRAEDARRVNDAVGRLPLDFRMVVVLRDLEDLSYKEIAAVVGIPLGTVMSRLARGRRLLLADLGRCKQESSDDV